MLKQSGIVAATGAGLGALCLLLAPALAATNQPQTVKKARPAPSFSAGGFTPSVADPRLAAEFARRGLQANSFRFTPSSVTNDKSKSVKVAIRARAITPGQAVRGATLADSATSATPVTAITPTAYNLGVAVGWRQFALSGDVARVQGGPIPTGREAAEVGVSYLGKKVTGRVAVAAERSEPSQLRIAPQESSVALDVGASYRLTRNLDVTGGVRYKIQRDRLEPLADERRDSQAVYVGTAFRF